MAAELFKRDRLYSVKEIAEKLDVSEKTITREINNPDTVLKSHKIRRTVRVTGASLITYMKNCEMEPWK